MIFRKDLNGSASVFSRIYTTVTKTNFNAIFDCVFIAHLLTFCWSAILQID